MTLLGHRLSLEAGVTTCKEGTGKAWREAQECILNFAMAYGASIFTRDDHHGTLHVMCMFFLNMYSRDPIKGA